jgi:uncharacterized protein (TIGR02466 family)
MMDLFPIPLLKEKLELPCSKIAKEILAARSQNTNYTSYFDEDSFPIESFPVIAQAIMKHGNQFFSSISDRNIEFDTDDIHIWWNVYREGDHHCFHDHARALLSGTIYINADETSAPFDIESPLDGLIRSWAGSDLTGRYNQSLQFNVEANTIYIWPSWLKHSVPTQSETDNPRITISFNLDKRK